MPSARDGDEQRHRAQALTVQCVIGFNRISERVTESVEVDDVQLRTTVVREIVLPRPAEGGLAQVPFAWVRKGETLHNLEVTDGTGAALAVLSAERSRAIVRAAVTAAFLWTRGPDTTVSGSLEEVLADLIGWVESDEPAGDGERTLFAGRLQLLLPARSNDRIDSMMRFCVRVRSAHVLVAEAPVQDGARLVLRYRYTCPVGRRTKSGRRADEATLRDRASLLLSWRPTQFVLPLLLIRQADSYSFRFPVPAGHYVAGAAVLEPDGMAGDTRRLVPWEPPPESRLGVTAAGLTYVQADVDGAPRTGPELYLRCTTAELQPGSLLQPLLAGVGGFVLGLLVLLLYRPLLLEEQSITSDLPGLLLALVGLLSSLRLGPREPDLVAGSASARAGTLANTAIAVAATCLYITQALGGLRWDEVYHLGPVALTVNHWWLAVVVTQGAILITLWRRLRTRMRRQSQVQGLLEMTGESA